jgi:hypothetical protein
VSERRVDSSFLFPINHFVSELTGVMKDYKLKRKIYTPRKHWVDRGTGTPKDKDEVNR